MAKGYLIAQLKVTDPTGFAAYAKASSEVLSAFGARLLIKPDTAIVAEGNPRPRTVIFEFASFEDARRCWDSDEYQKTIPLRTGASDGDFILVEGVD